MNWTVQSSASAYHFLLPDATIGAVPSRRFRSHDPSGEWLDGCGTNILAARLRGLEANGIVRRRKLPPPAASSVYELTDAGRGLQPVLHALCNWGLRNLGPPTADVELPAGWLEQALRTLAACADPGLRLTVRRYSNEFPQLARLVTSRVWLATGRSRATGTVYRVIDTGLRCIRAPCFSLRATVVNGTRSLMLSNLDLTGVGVAPATIARAHAALTRGGVLVSGTIRTLARTGIAAPGRTFAATQLWLPA